MNLRPVSFVASLGALALFALGCGGSGSSSSPAPTPDEGGEFLFTQTAEGGTFTPVDAAKGTYKVSFTGVFPSTVYFSDRPQRIVGQTPMAAFLKGLGFGASNPPNAAIVVPNGDGEDDDEIVVVELTKPVWDKDAKTLGYDVKILDDANGQLAVYQGKTKEKLPASFGTASVLIDDCPTYSEQVGHTEVSPILSCPSGGVAPTKNDPSYTMGAKWSWKKAYCMPLSHPSASNGITAWDEVFSDASQQWNQTYPGCCFGDCEPLNHYME